MARWQTQRLAFIVFNLQASSVNVVIWLQGTIIFNMFLEVPSAPSIIEVRAFSTTAQIQFAEPESTGGVPVLKYKIQWRMKGWGSWTQGVYDIQQGDEVVWRK